jgi:oligosaccharide repeat unit polymerase
MTIELTLLWFLIGGVLVLYLWKGVLDVRNAFAPPLIVAGLMFNSFILAYFEFDESTLTYLLDPYYYSIALLYGLFCLVMFSVTYEMGVAREAKRAAHVENADYVPQRLLIAYVSALSLVGLYAQYYVASFSGGLTAYYSQAHGAAGDWENISGYIHALPSILWAALAIAFTLHMTAPKSSRYVLALVIVLVAALGANTFLFGNRNGMIRFMIILGGVYVFVKRPTFIKSLPVIGLLIGAAAVTQVIAYIRGDLHLGSDVGLMDAISNYFSRREEAGGKLTINYDSGAGHELFFNIAVIQTSLINSLYDFGLDYLFPIVNFVPRGWWPGKPNQVEFNGLLMFEAVRQTTGWNPGNGAAYGALGHTFVAFSWFGSLLWGLLGYVSGKTFARARRFPSIMNMGMLLSVNIALVFWITQSYNAFFWAWFITACSYFGLRLFARLSIGKNGAKSRASVGQYHLRGRFLPSERLPPLPINNATWNHQSQHMHAARSD